MEPQDRRLLLLETLGLREAVEEELHRLGARPHQLALGVLGADRAEELLRGLPGRARRLCQPLAQDAVQEHHYLDAARLVPVKG